MKTLSEKQALRKLRDLKNNFRELVKRDYEFRAKDCLTCETPGACCTDAHFVNVHITRLEAALIDEELGKLAPAHLESVKERIRRAVGEFGLSAEGDTFAQTFACPLFEKGAGCLVHAVKPVPCIAHACYDRREDLPPDELTTAAEAEIEKLDARTYKKHPRWLPLPVYLTIVESD
ncbi:MAG: hypothetical protein JSS81_14550 [Acidobacteria bacterium]|nr:hypothetical protein [Acidobacteriota bacterium]